MTASGNKGFAPQEIRRWIARSPFRYPAYDQTEPLKGFSHLPVFPFLWDQLQGRSQIPSVEALFEGLVQEAIPQPPPAAIENRARKLVLDFGRELHAYTMLVRLFDQVSWRAQDDLGEGIDFVISLSSGSLVGVKAYMRAQWRPEDWESIKERRRMRRGEQTLVIPVIPLTNFRFGADRESASGTWLFRLVHIEEVEAAIKQLGLGYQGAL